MPRHQQITTCLKGGGPLSKSCSCHHCSLHVCAICGAYEGSLTTDCPGERVDYDKQQEVYETPLDFTDARGWHLGESMTFRAPRFEAPQATALCADPRAEIAPSIDWAAVDRAAVLQQELVRKVVAWVLADRTCDDRAAAVARVEDEACAHVDETELDEHGKALLAQLEREKIDFRLACRGVEERDQEMRQAAKQLVAALEESRR